MTLDNKIIKLKAIQSEIFEQSSNIRLDKFITNQIPDISRSKIQYLIKNKFVLLGDIPIVDSSYKVKINDEFTLQIPEVKPTDIIPKNIDIDIVFEDDDLAVVNKPPGLVTHPGAGNYDNTLVNGLLAHFKKNLSSISGIERPGIVHRLDKNTSGLLLIAKNDIAHAKLAKSLQERKIKRIYWAIIWGTTAKLQDTIITNIGRHPRDRKKMSVLQDKGKKAITHYKILKIFLQKAFSLIECQLETGRTHQIRVHLNYLGHPIVGDPEYGNVKYKKFLKIPSTITEHLKIINRQMLHAKKLVFYHPITGKLYEFEANLPEDMDYLNKCLSTTKL